MGVTPLFSLAAYEKECDRCGEAVRYPKALYWKAGRQGGRAFRMCEDCVKQIAQNSFGCDEVKASVKCVMCGHLSIQRSLGTARVERSQPPGENWMGICAHHVAAIMASAEEEYTLGLPVRGARRDEGLETTCGDVAESLLEWMGGDQ